MTHTLPTSPSPQERQGTVTLAPRVRLDDYWTLIHNAPNRAHVQQRLRLGEEMTWRSLAMMRNRLTIQQALDDAMAECTPERRGSGSDYTGVDAAYGTRERSDSTFSTLGDEAGAAAAAPAAFAPTFDPPFSPAPVEQAAPPPAARRQSARQRKKN